MGASSNPNRGRLLSECLKTRDQVGILPDPLFEFPVHQLNGAGVESTTGHLSEPASLRTLRRLEGDCGKINKRLAPGADNLPGSLETKRDAQFSSKDIHCPHRQD